MLELVVRNMIDLILLSISSGILAGITACVLPTYPVLLNTLSRTQDSKKLVSILFVLGMVLIFIL